jgi:hypothetical protein
MQLHLRIQAPKFIEWQIDSGNHHQQLDPGKKGKNWIKLVQTSLSPRSEKPVVFRPSKEYG